MRKVVFSLMIILFTSSFIIAQETPQTASQTEQKSEESEKLFFTKIGQKVPSFKFADAEGKTHKIEDFKGKVVLLNFFATWCGPCMAEMPKIESDIWQTLNKEDFVVISIGREHTVAEVKEFNEKKGFTFILGADPDREIFKKFGPSMIPRNYVLDKNGKIKYQEHGYSETEFYKLTALIKEFFKED